MKKAINLFAIPALAALILKMLLNSKIGAIDAGIIGTIAAGLPLFILGLATNWMEANRPPATLPEFTEEPAEQPEQEIYIYTPPQAGQTPQLYAGQVFTAPGANCQLRVKALKY